MRLSADLVAFSDRLGHRFARPELLIRALTHPSVASEGRPTNQRLEFLGDRVLNLILAEALFHADAHAAEGQLAPRYNVLVRKETCADVARDIGMGPVLKLGRSETLSGGRRKETSLADAMEAVIAAIYLDAGFDAAREVVLRLWASRIASVDEDAKDPKTQLQEWAQARGMPPPDYVELSRSGPDHAPVFTVAARLADGQEAQATARNKRDAQMQAARALLGALQPG